jgi:glycosyltransferase involved in cell wall biosynthesis
METADEIWTTSPWCKEMIEKHGFSDVKVYMHGVNASEWRRKRRRVPDDRPLRFLHVGEPAVRKNGQLTYDIFKETFGDRSDVSLTIKAHGYHTIKGKNSDNVTVLAGEMEQFELEDLYRRHDVLVYPSAGEGFGFIPLQGMLTGMPTICTAAWAPYKDYLLPELALPSMLVSSPWPDVHPGNVYWPDEKALSRMMELAADRSRFNDLSLRAYAKSFEVEKAFDWVTLTTDAFAHIKAKF